MLRYLADAYRALRQTVPDEARTEELDDLVEWLGELVRQVDSSLLDEWEALRDPGDGPAATPAARRGRRPAAGHRNARAFRVLVRNAMFRRVELAARRAGTRARRAGRRRRLGRRRLGATRWRPTSTSTTTSAPAPTPAARALLIVEHRGRPGRLAGAPDPRRPGGDHDWGITAEVDLAASDEAGEAVIRVTAVGPTSFLVG